MADNVNALVVDNHDSFTFNLVDQLALQGAECTVVRNDLPAASILARAEEDGARLIVLSPGPGAPREAGSCLELIRLAAGRTPVLGVCLGHQAIVEAFGGEVGPADTIEHGKTALTRHQGHLLFVGVPSEFRVGRYHSLIARRVPNELEVIAGDHRCVMAVAHRTFPIYGLQFHPESILTLSGPRILANVLTLAGVDACTPA